MGARAWTLRRWQLLGYAQPLRHGNCQLFECPGSEHGRSKTCVRQIVLEFIQPHLSLAFAISVIRPSSKLRKASNNHVTCVGVTLQPTVQPFEAQQESSDSAPAPPESAPPSCHIWGPTEPAHDPTPAVERRTAGTQPHSPRRTPREPCLAISSSSRAVSTYFFEELKGS